MTDFELFLTCLLIPAAYVVIYICGKHDILALICKMLVRRCEEIEKEMDCCEWQPEKFLDHLPYSCITSCGHVDHYSIGIDKYCRHCGKKIQVVE